MVEGSSSSSGDDMMVSMWFLVKNQVTQYNKAMSLSRVRTPN